MLQSLLGIDPVALALSLIGILLSGSLLLSAYILWHRVRLERADAHLRERRRIWMPLVLGYLSGSNTTAEIAAEVPQREVEPFTDFVLNLVDDVEGDDIDHLRVLLDELGILQRHLAEVRHQDRYRAIHAIVVLGRLRAPHAAAPLREVLAEDGRNDVGFLAAASLAAIGDPRDLSSVFERLTRDPHRSEQAVAQVLLDFGTHLGDGLAGLLRSGQRSARDESILVDLLGTLEHVEALPLVAGRLGISHDPELRRRAARSLGHLGSPNALSALHEAASDPDERLRLEVVTALRRIGADESGEILAGRLTDRSAAVCHAAATALLQLGGSGRARVEAAAAGDGVGAASARGALAEWRGEPMGEAA